MSNQLYKLNIDLLKITGAKVITGKDNVEYLAIDIAKSGIYYKGKGAYLNLDMRENNDGVDQYDNTHMIVIAPTKEQREALRTLDGDGNAHPLDGHEANAGGPMNHPSVLESEDRRYLSREQLKRDIDRLIAEGAIVSPGKTAEPEKPKRLEPTLPESFDRLIHEPPPRVPHP